MQVDMDQDGLVHLSLEKDEQIYVKIGGAEVIIIGGEVNAIGAGPLTQVALRESTARLEVQHWHPGTSDEYLDIRIVAPGSDETGGERFL